MKNLSDLYFEWLIEKIDPNHVCRMKRMMLERLFDTEFYWKVYGDSNRVEDAINLRDTFCSERPGRAFSWDTPVSVLEVLIALAIRCEEDIMRDDRFGDRTPDWFWTMINNLGLFNMTNDVYDEDKVDRVLKRFLNRSYPLNGDGNVFKFRNAMPDIRKTQLWFQMSWYLNEQFPCETW